MTQFDSLIVLTLIVGAFIAGLKLSGYYYSKILKSEPEKVEKIEPEKRGYVPIGQPFMDRLSENGHATQALRINRN